jgi:protein disulfide-isomerase-like protein
MKHLVCLVALVLLSCVGRAVALPFGKDSGVTELTPQSFQKFVNSHKPVFVMFYAPWCGHCKSAHPEWSKFGKAMKDVVKVGAIDADKYRDIGGQFGIQGFPTIKYWRAGMDAKKKGPQDYQGQRSYGAFHKAAMAEVRTDKVVVAKDMASINAAIASSEKKLALVLVTDKPKPAPLLGVLSYSPNFAGKAAFITVLTKKTPTMVEALGSPATPSLLVLGLRADGTVDVAGATRYDGAVEYNAVAKFLLARLDGASAGDAADDVPATPAPEAKETPKAPKSALPTTVVPVTAVRLRDLCDGNAASRKQPLCVILFKDADAVAATELFNSFGQEPLVVFTVPVADTTAWTSAFADVSSLAAPDTTGVSAVIWRSAKKGAHKMRWWAPESSGSAAAQLTGQVERCLTGECGRMTPVTGLPAV